MAIINPASLAQKGHVSAVIYDKTSQVPFVLPVPSGSSVGVNAQQQELTESNCRGVIQTVFRSTQQQDFTLDIQFGYKLPDLIAIALGRRLTEATSLASTWGMGAISVPDVENPAYTASAAGTWGNGVAADAPAKASYLDQFGITRELTQGTFATFNAATDDSFAVGADSALKFSNNLRGRRVSIDEVAITLAALDRLGDALGEMAATIYMINNAFQLVRWLFPSITVNPQSINNGDAAQSMQFFVNGEPQYEILRQLYPCRDAS